MYNIKEIKGDAVIIGPPLCRESPIHSIIGGSFPVGIFRVGIFPVKRPGNFPGLQLAGNRTVLHNGIINGRYNGLINGVINRMYNGVIICSVI